MRLFKLIAAEIFMVAAFVLTVRNLEFIPYNVKELFSQNNVVISIIVFSMVLYITFGVPVLLASCLTHCKNGYTSVLFPVVGAVFGVITFFLLYFNIPIESLHDIVGSPVFKWPWVFESMYRFVFLFSVFWVLWCGSALIVNIPKTASASCVRSLVYWAVNTLFTLIVSYWVVVQNAATDNITELLENGGGLISCLMIGLWILVIGLTASLICKKIISRQYSIFFLFLLIICSIPTGYYLLKYGMVNDLTKYGKTFSGMQFLLSTDRNHYAEGFDLIVRYSILHLGLIFIMSVCQLPFWETGFSKKDRTGISAI